MSRTIVGGLLAGLVLAPALASAMPNRGAKEILIPNTNIGELTTPTKAVMQNGGNILPQRDNGSLGGGMYWGTDPGHVATPPNAQIDPESRGPLNDVQPGTPESSDTLQAKNPRPVR